MDKQNRMWFVVVAGAVMVFLVVALAYLHNEKKSGPVVGTAPDTLCLQDSQVASQETIDGVDYIVIRDQNASAEIRRFPLATSTIRVTELGKCAVRAVLGSGYREGARGGYELAPGGALEVWEYSYDGKAKDLYKLVDNAKGGLPALCLFNSSSEYVSAVWLDKAAHIEIRRVNSGERVFETDTQELSRKVFKTEELSVSLWHGFPGSAFWSHARNGEEEFRIELEELESGLSKGVVAVNMKTWTY